MYQSGLIYGLIGKSEEKVSAMKRLITEFPTSRFVVDAYFETAEEYTVMGRMADAEKYYTEILEKFPSNPRANRAYSTLGRIYYNSNKMNSAVDIYSKLYDNYPGTPEAKIANDMVKKIYAEQGDAKQYVRWKKDRGGISNEDQDSLMYEVGYNAYEKEILPSPRKGLMLIYRSTPKVDFICWRIIIWRNQTKN